MGESVPSECRPARRWRLAAIGTVGLALLGMQVLASPAAIADGPAHLGLAPGTRGRIRQLGGGFRGDGADRRSRCEWPRGGLCVRTVSPALAPAGGSERPGPRQQ
jgi:hypothetical protein